MTEWLHVEDRASQRWLTIDRPRRRNAVPAGGWSVLADAFQAFEASPQRVLVVTGAAGDFCSGADVAGDTLGFDTVEEGRATMEVVASAVRALHGLSKPSVAAVDGVAVGAGMNLALGCDVVLASRTARFAELFVRRGLVVDFGGMWLLPRMVGLARARELALTGRMVDAAEAEAIGLVARVVDDVAEAAAELAAELAAGPPLAQSMIKRGLVDSFARSFEESLMYESESQALALASDDAAEGVRAFVEKRAPRFRGT